VVTDCRPPRANRALEIDIEMRHRVAAHHHRDVGSGIERPGMGKRSIPPVIHQSDKIFVLPHRRVSVIAGNPEVHLLPSAFALGVVPNLRDCVIYDRERARDDGVIVSARVRCLVDTRERDERVSRAFCAQSVRGSFSNRPVDRQPPAHVTPKVSCSGASDEAGVLTHTIASAKSARDDAERAEARFRQLEDRRRCRIDVAIHEPHVDADVAARKSGESSNATRAVEPAESGQADAARVSSH